AQTFEGLRRGHLVDEMAVDIEQAGAVIGLVNQMIVPDFVVQRGRLGHERKPLRRLREQGSADRREQSKRRSGITARVKVLKSRRSKTSERGGRQSAGNLQSQSDWRSWRHSGLIWNHVIF